MKAQRFRNQCIVLGILLIIFLVIHQSGLREHISLEAIKAEKHNLEFLIANHYLYAIASFIGIYIVVTASSIPVAALLTIAGGYFFGVIPGALYANIGATIGATIAFLLSRYFIGSYVQRHYSERLKRFNREMKNHGTLYLLLLHFVAVIPFFIVNTFAGLTKVSVWTFVWTTAVGIIPGSLVYAFAGRQLTTVSSPGDVFSWPVILAFALLVFMALIPILIKRFKMTKMLPKK